MFSQAATQHRPWITIVAALVVSGCAGTPAADRSERSKPVARQAPPSGTATTARSAGERAAVVAVRQIGTPYRYGGSAPGGFDCSGLVQFAYAQAGRRVPRTTATQWQAFRPVPNDRLQTGDVLFFRIEGKMSHVGLYLGDGRFVHAPASGREVSVATLDSAFYRHAFIRAGRP